LVTTAPCGVTMNPLPCPVTLPRSSNASMITTAFDCSRAISLGDFNFWFCAKTAAGIKSARRMILIVIRISCSGNPRVRIASGVQSWAENPLKAPERA
jgi:hypothetical protein